MKLTYAKEWGIDSTDDDEIAEAASFRFDYWYIDTAFVDEIYKGE